LRIDGNRLLSQFAARLSFAVEGYAERRRGRKRSPSDDALTAAVQYGVDLSLLTASLKRTPAERLRSADDDARFLSTLQIVSE
jgi:hypothetical protein